MNFAELTSQQWLLYERHMLFSTVNSDFTAYDYKVAGSQFWALFGSANDAGATEAQKRETAQRLHDVRMASQPIKDVESTRIYLWKEGNIPASTVYTENRDYEYADSPDFRPYMVEIPVPQDVAVKGVVILCSGGAFLFRNNFVEGGPVAEELSKLGYHCFVVNYRLNPYTMQEGALDLARAVRYVRSHAEEYDIDEKDIAVMGFSAGGILCGELSLHYAGAVDGTTIDPGYVPDELDKISANASAVGMIYSFYGRLSVASTDVEEFMVSDLPPAFFLYGTKDSFVNSFDACANALRQAGVPVKSHVLQGWPHGFGAGDGKWILYFDKWLTGVFDHARNTSAQEADA